MMGRRKDVAPSETQVSEPDLSHIEPGLRHLAVPISSLKPNPHQVNQHDERNLEAIARSFRKHGQKKNAVANAQGEMAAGWGMVLAAAQKLGWSHLAVVLSDEDQAGLEEYALEDDQTARLSRSDDAALLAELCRLEELGTPPSELGWSVEELEDLRVTLEAAPVSDLLSETDLDSLISPAPGKTTDETGEVGLFCGAVREKISAAAYQVLLQHRGGLSALLEGAS